MCYKKRTDDMLSTITYLFLTSDVSRIIIKHHGENDCRYRHPHFERAEVYSEKGEVLVGANHLAIIG